MDNIEASCVFYVEVGMFTHLEQSKIFLLNVEKSGILTLTVQHDRIVSDIFTLYHGDYFRQTSADILCLKLHPIYLWRLGDSGGCTPQFILVTKQPTSDLLIADCGAVGNRWELQLYSA